MIESKYFIDTNILIYASFDKEKNFMILFNTPIGFLGNEKYSSHMRRIFMRQLSYAT
jgi:predicted nucleic acid-binding protein